MKISIRKTKAVKSAFTLIEMIGVLAVIGILAALLIPKIFEAINNARINSAAASIASVKTAIADHYAKYGSLQSSNGVAISLATTTTNYDTVLLNEGFMDKLLSLKIADPTNTTVNLVGISGATNNQAVTAATGDYFFDLADTNAICDVSGTAEVAIVLNNVLEADAKSLNDLIDGPTLGVALGSATGDKAGRVKHSPVGAGGLVNMAIYVTHR